MTASRVRLILLAAAGAAALGCHTRPPAVPSAAVAPARPAFAPARPAPTPPAPATAARRPEPTAAPVSEAEAFRRLSLADLNAQQPLGDAFFDYDQWSLRGDARAAVQRDADWLKKWPSTAVRIDGHADERGTAEYNLALGERRARTVQDYLVSLGIAPDRVRIATLGKEAPFCTGADEACWSQNRRGHFVITAK